MARKPNADLDPVEEAAGEGTEKVQGKGKTKSEPGSMKVVVVKR
jgi:hypothetical protein